MNDFLTFITEHIVALIFAVIGIISSIITIISFLKDIGKKTKLVKSKYILIGLIILSCFLYVWDQYRLFKKETLIHKETSLTQDENYNTDHNGDSANVQGSGTAIIGNNNMVNINNPTSSPDPIVVTDVSLNKTELNLCSGETVTLIATVLYSDNSQDNQVIWVSTDETVLNVDKNGNVTALSAGTASIIAQASKNNISKSETCTITVNEIPSGYSISLSSTEANLGEIFYVYVEPYEDDITQIEVHGKSPSGTIFNKPLENGAMIIYTEPGVWTISASIKNNVGTYEAVKEEDFVTINITDISQQLKDIFSY